MTEGFGCTSSPGNGGEAVARRGQAMLRYLLLLLVLAVVLCVRLRLLQAPLERDEGEYAYLGQLLLHGIPPYANAYTMKLPGVGAAYALFMTLFGQTTVGIHLGLLVVNLASCALVFLLGRRLFDANGAAASCAAYAILSLSQSVYGVFAHATQFMVPFVLAGLLLQLRALERGNRAGPLLAAGLCFGIAVAMKQHAALLVVFALLHLAWSGRRGGVNGLLRTSVPFLVGTFLPYALILAVCAKAGVLGRFWFWTVQYAREYAHGQGVAQGWFNLMDACDYLFTTQPSLWLLAGAGALLLLTGRGRCTDKPFLFGLLIFSFLATSPGLYFRHHYFVLLLPAVALLAGAAVASADLLLAASVPARLRRRFPLMLLFLAAAFGLYREKNYFYFRTPQEVSRTLYGSNPFPEAPEIARYLSQHTARGDRIAVLGSEPEIYFYADRLAATGHIYMYGLMEEQPYAERMQEELIREVEAARPAYLVVVNVATSWLRQPASPRTLSNWQEAYLRAFYRPVALVDILDEKTVYIWDDPSGYAPRSDSTLTVYRRNG
jgi:hypothetical protein